MAYPWKTQYETGNTTIGTQHKQLIGAINDLLEACSAGKGRQQIQTTSKFLSDYTKTHFSDEEQLQIKSKYPDYQNHKKYHDGFIKVVDDIVAQLDKEGPTIAMVAKINTTIAGWLLNHISKEDVKVAQHIKSVS